MYAILPLLAAAAWAKSVSPEYTFTQASGKATTPTTKPKPGESVLLPEAGVVATRKKPSYIVPIILTLISAWKFVRS